LFLYDRYATTKREITTTRMELSQSGLEFGRYEKRRKDRETEVGTYKMRFMIVAFLNFGPSLVGKIQMLKMPPWKIVGNK
jgi:hypothetical protein